MRHQQISKGARPFKLRMAFNTLWIAFDGLSAVDHAHGPTFSSFAWRSNFAPVRNMRQIRRFKITFATNLPQRLGFRPAAFAGYWRIGNSAATRLQLLFETRQTMGIGRDD